MTITDRVSEPGANQLLVTETPTTLSEELGGTPALPGTAELGVYDPNFMAMLLLVWFVREFRRLIEACGEL